MMDNTGMMAWFKSFQGAPDTLYLGMAKADAHPEKLAARIVVTTPILHRSFYE